MLKAVFFDFDGTLGDTLKLCVDAFRQALEPLTGRRYTDEQIVSTFGPSEEGTITRFLPPEQYQEGLDRYFHWYEKLHEESPKPFPGLDELLHGLKKAGIFVALVTGKGPVTCALSLKKYGIEDLFDAIEPGSPEGPCKPDAMRRIFERFALRPDETLYVGDMPSDVAAAREVGVETLAVAWASTADQEALRRENPLALFTRVDDLRDFLEQQIGQKLQ